METYQQEAERIVDSIYKAYGTDSGILFGITERDIVKAIVEFTINRLCSTARQMGQAELEAAKKEIERLKGLIKEAHRWGAEEFSEGCVVTVDESFEEFCAYKNL